MAYNAVRSAAPLGLLASCDGLSFCLKKRIGVAAVKAFQVQSLRWTGIGSAEIFASQMAILSLETLKEWPFNVAMANRNAKSPPLSERH
jgi:hypothetical protein